MKVSGKIAVLMPVYTGDKPSQVVEAISSILAQTYSNFILFVGCDGPLAADVANAVAKFNDERLRVVRFPENRGLAHTLNSLIDLALQDQDVDFIARMDADDISMEERFEQQVQFLGSNPGISVLGAGCYEITGSGNIVFEKRLPERHSTLARRFIKQCPLVHPTVMFRRQVFEAGARYPTEYVRSEDLAFWLTLMGEGYQFANMQRPLLLFRIGDDFLKRRADRKKGWAEFRVRIKAIKQLGLPVIVNLFYAMAQLGVKASPAILIGFAYRIARSQKSG
ncbi:glycosyltransferase [Marinobacter sp. VGCF2001]|uniref:glycosyltransferase n=1 Tax=Marinobacter sp. VGCF2001 TaxID=3417189 RepID=UPI003CF0158D